jgi:putative NADH-flavin reductase
MNIVIFGANGAIGTYVLNQALSNGDKVTAYVRRANSISIKHDLLNVIVGDLQNATF